MTRQSLRVAARAAVATLATAVVAGCGAGPGEESTGVKLTVTDGFGAKTLLELPTPKTAGDDTVMRLLERNAKVEKRYGGGFVQSINGVTGGREGSRPQDWFYFVNGILADKGAASVDVHGGARVWWDRHDWGTVPNIPAVIGSFPEPFLNGFDGERLPTRISCDRGFDEACEAIQQKFGDLGLVVGKGVPGTESTPTELRVFVGRWPALRGDRATRQLEEGPKSSGVFARIAPDGKRITTLDASGKAVRELGPGTGLIAATRWRDHAPTWVVTGTDDAGIRTAVDAFDESVMAEKFALAIADGLPVPLPDAGKDAAAG